MISREQILLTIQQGVEPLEFVNAMWQGGAAAFDRVDSWSDIDLQVDVDDAMVEETFTAIERSLETLSPIALKYRLPEPTWHGHSQSFYRLRDTSEFLMIDLVVIRQSSAEKFLQPEVHGNAVIAFDKHYSITPQSLDKRQLQQRLRSRLEMHRVHLELFRSTVLKELNRGNDIEALSFYQGMILRPLVEVLRIRYAPARHSFHTRYIHYDLPQQIVERLRPLFFVTDVDDLQNKFFQAEEFLREQLDEITIELTNAEP